ncbi:hypothetical protein G6F43_011759 [Rhizopus delemar]|nr:hypothetical protein G6F43_011759 [Rhizopus delemar]
MSPEKYLSSILAMAACREHHMSFFKHMAGYRLARRTLALMDWGAVRAAAWLIIHFQFQGLSELLICILLIPTDQSINTSKKNNGHVYFRLDKFGASNAGMGILLNTSLFIVHVDHDMNKMHLLWRDLMDISNHI